MDAIVRTAPPANTADPGDLYVDLQSRTLWLGVDESVDPAGFVLISDIVTTMERIDQTLFDAKAYADQQDELRALVDHTHPASDIEDFENAVTEVINTHPVSAGLPFASIIIWAGSLADIGVGALANYHLCDGSVIEMPWGPWTLPDLRDRFIIGAGNVPPWHTQPLTQVQTTAAGAHIHTNHGFALTTYYMAPHYHYVEVGPTQAYGVTYGGAGHHNHSIFGPHWTGSYLEHDGSDESDRGVHSTSYTHGSSGAGGHDHNCYVNVHIGANTNWQGSGAAHTHGMDWVGDHGHWLTSANIRDTIPYYSLAYIIKIV